jgi:penicillin-binding protein 2
LGIDLNGEAEGLVPTPQWKQATLGEQWYLGDTYHYGIGQGYLLTTPLQVNAWTQALANNGNLYKPYLLKDTKPQNISPNLLNINDSNLITEGMIEACSPGGVAWPLFNFSVNNSRLKIDNKDVFGVEGASGSADMRRISIACKTGTAESGGNKQPHAWITLFTPANNPQIIVTVLSEESGEGSNVAAPVAKKILENWFSR